MIDNVFDFEKELHLMNEDELRSLLRTLYLSVDMAVSVQSAEEHSDHFATEIQSIFNTLDENRNREKTEQQALNAQKPREIHIAIGESPLGSIKVAMGRVPGRSERRFLSMNDYYAIGPLGDLTNKVDLHRRHLWLLEKLYLSEHGSYAVQGMDKLLQLNNMLSSIDEDTRITIWYANNAHERTGLLYAMHLLRNRLGPIYLIETSALYQELFNPSGVQHDVLRTGEIFSEKLLAMWQHCVNAEPLSLEKRKHMDQEWVNLAVQPGLLRLMKDGEIQSVPEDAIDEYIMQKVREVTLTRQPGEFIKSARVVGEVLGHLEQAVGDAFIEYRVRQLIIQGRLEMEGKPHAMRFYSVRLPQ
ncbi:hypothetical protein DC345_11050 [Paenibacillus taichungensis]|uniref:DUF1835 domain-containing protein n=1 Tax=Paenibacillus taichungensis TaxID=484184 RepID=A0A329QV85_9BACL|nr:DUF1835 domain-containing protein [Paenibacillus taichungensis]RAW16021.1 hypothetical protein DC345_11050 [Paenibacillus taichungensis]